MDSKEVIPDGIKDVEAWRESVKLQNHFIIKKPKFTTSEGVELNLAMMIHNLKSKIVHLPTHEQDRILKLKALYYKINNNLTIQKRKAIGLKQGQGSKSGEEYQPILEERKEEILEYYGRMFTVEEIMKIINMQWGITINKTTLYHFKLKYSEEIKKRIEGHQTTYHNIRLGIKKSRLEELSELYTKAKDNWRDSNKREDLKVLLTILEQLRKEAEGDRLTIDGKVDIKYEQNIQVHLMKEVFATTNLKEIILGRVASKMGINPIKLIYSLNNSYYKQYSNVLGDFDENDNKELPYPSQLNYDFERIGKNFLLRDKEIEEAIIVEEKSNEKDLNQGLSLKEILARKLRKKNEDIERFQTKIEIMDERRQDFKNSKNK